MSYVCPMLFDSAALYEEAKLDSLRFVPIATAPPLDNSKRHFIYFRNVDDYQPVWCSDPTPGKAIAIAEWMQGFRRLLNAVELLELLEKQHEIMLDGASFAARFRDWGVADQLTIVEFTS